MRSDRPDSARRGGLPTGEGLSPSLLRYKSLPGRWVLFVTVLGSALAFIDATVVNIALPHIGRSLGADSAGLQWTTNGYTLALTSFILLGGSLGDRLGRRRVFLVGAAWFAVASLLCGLAPRIEVLVAARVLQGIGGALLTPGSLALLQASFRPEDRALAIGAWSGLGGVGGALGPFLGGWLLQVASWRLVFLINVPLAVVVVVAGLRHLPESKDPGAGRRLDLAGAAAAAAGLAGLSYGFIAWSARGIRSPAVLAALCLGAAGWAAFVLREWRAEEPMLPLEVFSSKTFTAANVVTFAVYAALGGVFFLVTLNLQVVARFTPLAAGTAMLPITVLMLLLSARAGALSQRLGPRIPMALGPAISALALLLLSRVGAGASYLSDVLPAMVLLGLGLSLTVAPLTATVLGSVDDRHAGLASAVNNAVARAAGLLAVAILPLLGGLGHASLTDPLALAPMYRNAMWICAGLLAAAGAVALASIPGRASADREGRAGPRAIARGRYHCDVSGPPLAPPPPRRLWARSPDPGGGRAMSQNPGP